MKNHFEISNETDGNHLKTLEFVGLYFRPKFYFSFL